MANLFDVINEKMFSIFNCPLEAKRNNYDLLSFIYDLFTKNGNHQFIDRLELVEFVSTYLSSREFASMMDEEGHDLSNKSAREKASSKIRQFKNAGWLEEDSKEDNAFDVTYSLSNGAISLMNAFQNLISKEERPLEYSGYFNAVYLLLMNFEFERSKATLEQVEKDTNELFTSLQGINSSIRKYIEQLIKNDKLTPNDIMEILLDRYQKQVIVAVFNNLRTNDNPDKYISGILEKLYKFRNEDIDKITFHYMKTLANENQDITDELKKETKEKIQNLLTNLIEKYQDVNEFIELIDQRNGRFHTSATRKLNFLLNTRNDLDGLLVQCMKEINKSNLEDYSSYIPIDYSSLLDDKSIFSQPFNPNRITASESIVPQASEEELQALTKHLFLQNEFSKDKVNEYVLSHLQGRKSIFSKEIPIETNKELFFNLLIQIYSQYDDMCYVIRLLDETYNTYGYQLMNYEIIRKESQHD